MSDVLKIRCSFGEKVLASHVFENKVEVAKLVEVARSRTNVPVGRPRDDVAKVFIWSAANRQKVIEPC